MNILKTVLSAGLGLGLSLTGIEVLAAEEDKKYRPNISFSGFYGENDRSYGSLDILFPVHQKNDRLVFVDLRGLIKKSPVKEFNVGGGYRWLSSDKQKLYGAYGFFDRKTSVNKNLFDQLTIGGELKTEQLKVLGLNTKGLSIGGNVYLPLGTKAGEKVGEVLDENLIAKAKPYRGDKFIIDFYGKEYAMIGLDVEVGHAIPKVNGLKGYLGGYYFDHNKVEEMMGPRATLIYDLSPLMPKKLTLIDHVELEASIQHDKPRGTTWYAGFRLQMQLGSSKDKPSLKGLEKQMTDFVRRDLDVVVEAGGETWTKENGQPYVGQIVTTEAELKALTGGKAKDLGEVDIIGVKGIIEVTGNDYTVGGTNTKAAVLLNYGQSITGQGLTFTGNDGREYTVKVVNSDQGIVGADPSLVGDGVALGGITLQGVNGKIGHLLQVYTDSKASIADRAGLEKRVQRIEDLTLIVPENNYGDDLTLGLRSSVITNLTGTIDDSGNENSFGHVVIDHIDANSNVYFGLDFGKSGKLRLTDSKFSISEMTDGYGGMAEMQSKDENDLVIESIDNNQLLGMTSKGEAYGLYVDYLNGPVVNNDFGLIESGIGENASGIEIGNSLTGTVSANTFSSITTTGDAQVFGIYIDGGLTGSVTGNVFSSIHSTAGDAYGIYQFDAGMKINITGVTDNTFNVTADGVNTAYGLRYKLDNTLTGDRGSFKTANKFSANIRSENKLTTHND